MADVSAMDGLTQMGGPVNGQLKGWEGLQTVTDLYGKEPKSQAKPARERERETIQTTSKSNNSKLEIGR